MTVSIPSTTLEKFTTFGDLLRFLRRRAGLTQTELALAVGYGHTQISRLEQNLRLPDIPTIEARFIPALGLEDEPKVVARLLELAANIRREDAPALGLCPYKGLNFFDEGDADLFVGREALTAALVEHILALASHRQPSEERFLAIVGASGSGKSSLVRAGVVPALRWNEASTDWQIHVITPTAHPLEALAISLTAENSSVATTASLMDDFMQDSRSLQIFVRRKLGLENGSRLLLVVDQFEELFALCRSEEERTAFISNLLTAGYETDGPVILVVTLRADFYAHCATYPELREALARHQEYIGAMNQEELRRAIEEPAQRGRWEFEPGLVDLLLHEVGHEPGALPLLSHALLETWQRRRGRSMTLSGYASSGGVRGAIAETAETVFADHFTPEERAIARRIFLRLTELNDESSAADTRRRASLNELILKPEEAATTHAVLKALADARLITTSEDSAEVAHEALIREWPTLRSWLEDNREGLRLHRHLTEAAQEWLEMNREPDLLYRGARLAQADEWAASHPEELNSLEQEFLAASIKHSERQRAEREAQRQRELDLQRQRAEEQMQAASQLRRRAFFLTGALIIAGLLAVTAFMISQRANREARLSSSRELAAAAISNLEIDPELSILLAIQAVAKTYETDHLVLPEAESALHRAVLASHVRLAISAHTDPIWSIAYSPDGKRIATASQDGTSKVWDAASGEELLTLNVLYDRGVSWITFSPDGTRLATGSVNNIAQLWDTATGKELLTLADHTDIVTAVAFSPDGKRLATASLDKTAKVWDIATGEQLITLTGHRDCVTGAAFSPDGTRLATASCDNTVKLWDLSTGQEVRTFFPPSQGDFVGTVAFSPDGMWLASGNNVWNVSTGTPLLTLIGHTNNVHVTVFSTDGQRLATTSRDRSVIVWHAVTGHKLLQFWGHMSPVWGVAFSSDGKHLATGDETGMLRIWDIGPDQELFTLLPPADAHEREGFRSVLFSPDGSRMFAAYNLRGVDDNLANAIGLVKVLDSATGEELLAFSSSSGITDIAISTDGTRLAIAQNDGTATLWNTGSRQKALTLRGHNDLVFDVTFSPDGARLATASSDGTARLWDVAIGQERVILPEAKREAPLEGVAFSPDGTRLAMSGDGVAEVLDLSSGKVVLNLTGHTDTVYDIAFSPDGMSIATASRDGTAKLWNAATGEELFTLRGHTSTIYGLVFSPDGTRLATGSTDATVKIWDVSNGQELLTLPGNIMVAFSPDGTRLVTGGRHDHTLRLYLLKIDDLMVLARSRVTRSLTSEECQKYLHKKTCPDRP